MPSHPPAPNTGTSTSSQRELANKKGMRPRSKLWLFVWLAFALQITAWVFWVKLASKHPVQEVPLVTAQPAETLNPGQAANNNLNPDAAATTPRQ